MPRRGENIYKRKDGRWEGRYQKVKIGGISKYGYVYARTYQEVKQKLSVVKLVSQVEARSSTGMLFSELSKKWLESQLINSKESTVLRYSSMLHNQILPYLGTMNTLEITTDILQSFSSHLLKEGSSAKNKGLSEKTVSDTICVVKSILRYGEKINIFHSCALSAVTVKTPRKEMRVLTCDEYKKLTAYLLCENICSSVGMLIALYTGMRIGELCALTFSDIDIVNKRINVNKTMQRLKNSNGKGTHISIDTPKSSSSVRVIPIPDFLCDIVKNHNYRKNDYILTGTDKFIEPRTLQYRYDSVMKGLKISGTTFHTLRHSFATRCVEVGFDIKSLSEILGHSSVSITLNRYVHSSFELKAENMKKLNVFFGSSPSNF